MATRLQGYGLAVLCLALALVLRLALLPFIGFGIFFGFALLCIWITGRYGGLGPSIFAMIAGALLAFFVSYLVPVYNWNTLELEAGLALYFLLGLIVIALCRSEHRARESLVLQLAERISLEEQRRSSEGRLQAIMDNTTAVIYLKDTQGRFLMVNRRFQELSTHGDVIGKTDADIFPANVVETIQANDRRVRDSREPLEFEEVVPQADGLHTYVAVKFPVFDDAGKVVAIGGISTDISERKRALDALEEEQELLQHTIEVQDNERQLIAYEIHDGLIQDVTGALMQLEALQATCPDGASPAQLDAILSTLRRALAEGRRLINGIRTPVLDGFGVVAAVEHLLREEERAHVEVEFIKGEGLERMEPKIEEAIYRITQEALTNISKHSQSKGVRIELDRRGEQVHLEVCDSGIGFTPSLRSTGVHGIRSMMERARIVGGKCHIESTPGKGTRVVVDVPYQRKC